jgi:hypothetical protein
MNKKAFLDSTWKILITVLFFLYLYVYEFNQDLALAAVGALMFIGMAEVISSTIVILYQLYKHFYSKATLKRFTTTGDYNED